MSGNSRSSCLTTAPIVSGFCAGAAARMRSCASAAVGIPFPRGGAAGVPTSIPLSITAFPSRSSAEEGELVLAHLKLVSVLQLVRLDPAPVDIGAVERTEVVDVVAVAPPHEQRVVARDRDVV